MRLHACILRVCCFAQSMSSSNCGIDPQAVVHGARRAKKIVILRRNKWLACNTADARRGYGHAPRCLAFCPRPLRHDSRRQSRRTADRARRASGLNGARCSSAPVRAAPLDAPFAASRRADTPASHEVNDAHDPQLTRFLDPAAESRALLTRFISVLGLRPPSLPPLPADDQGRARAVGRGTERAREHGEMHFGTVGGDGNAAYDRPLELEAC